MFSRSEKNAFVQRIREQREIEFPHVPEDKSCLCSSFLVCRELVRLGHRPILQCGSIYWRAVSRKADDGKMPTHYSMVWSPHEINSILSVATGRLPEIHCWVGLLETQEIIDLTVKFFPMAWKNAIGYDWTAKTPPDYVWSNIVSCQKKYAVRYEPLKDATEYGMHQITKILNRRKL